MKRREDDMLWKGIVEEVFDDLLRFLFPKTDEIFNMKRGFDFLDKELHDLYPEPERKSENRSVDKLIKVHRRDGVEEWILVHVEVQAAHEKAFAHRMFKYYCKIFDRLDHPITAVAIYTGGAKKRMPDSYSRIFQGTSLWYRFNTLHIRDYPDEALLKNKNPFALVLLAAKKALIKGKNLDEVLLEEKLLIVKILYGRGLFTDKKIKAIFYFLNNYVLFKKTETYRIFKERTDIITGKSNTMGIIEQVTEKREKVAMEKGRIEERQAIASSLLAGKKLSVEEIALSTNLPVDFVRKLNGGVKG